MPYSRIPVGAGPGGRRSGPSRGRDALPVGPGARKLRESRAEQEDGPWPERRELRDEALVRDAMADGDLWSQEVVGLSIEEDARRDHERVHHVRDGDGSDGPIRPWLAEPDAVDEEGAEFLQAATIWGVDRAEAELNDPHGLFESGPRSNDAEEQAFIRGGDAREQAETLGELMEPERVPGGEPPGGRAREKARERYRLRHQS